AVTDVVSAPPPTVRTPPGPAGTSTVNRLPGRNGCVGVNVASLPTSCQVPATAGRITGSGEPGASGAENWTITGEPPSTRLVPDVGSTDSTRSAATVPVPWLVLWVLAPARVLPTWTTT